MRNVGDLRDEIRSYISSTPLPPSQELIPQIPALPPSLPSSARSLSLRDQQLVLAKSKFDQFTLTMMEDLGRCHFQFRKRGWDDGCPLEFVLRVNVQLKYPDPEVDTDTLLPPYQSHNSIYHCRQKEIPDAQTSWVNWRHDMASHCMISSEYCTTCFTPKWSQTEWPHFQNKAKKQCSDWLKDYWIGLWFYSGRVALMAEVDAQGDSSWVRNRSQYQRWLVT